MPLLYQSFDSYMQGRSRFIAILLLLSLGFIWGTGYSIARFAMTHGVPPLGYSFWQSLGPALLLLSLARLQLTPSYPSLSRPSSARSPWVYYFVCALSGIVIPNTMMYMAAPHLPAGLLAVIVNTVPLMAYPMALVAGAETFHRARFISVLFAVLGLALIVIPKSSLPSPTLVPWVFATLITPFSFAFCSVYIDRFRPTAVNSLQSAAGTLFLASLILTPVVVGSHQFYYFHFPLTLPDGIILLEVVLSSVGYLLFFKLIEIAGPVYYSLVDTVVSLTGLMWGYVLFHEQLNQWTAPAVIFILCGLIGINKAGQSLRNVSNKSSN